MNNWKETVTNICGCLFSRLYAPEGNIEQNEFGIKPLERASAILIISLVVLCALSHSMFKSNAVTAIVALGIGLSSVCFYVVRHR